MTDIARIRWRSVSPTEIDEELVVDDAGTALLVVRTSRDRTPIIGTFSAPASAAEVTELDGQRRDVDLQHPLVDGVIATAERLAARARQHPLAAATFYTAAVPGGGLALQAVGAGEGPAEFQLEPDRVIAHLERNGTEIAWYELEPLATGFVSPAPEGLGGVGRPAEIPSGGYGTIALAGPTISGPGEVAVEVRGWLRDRLPERSYEPFRVRTAPALLPD